MNDMACGGLLLAFALAGCSNGAPAAPPHDADVDAQASSDATYGAYNLFTGAPRFGIFKASTERNVCVRIVFIWPGTNGDAALSMGDASVTQQAADCLPGNTVAPPWLDVAGIPAVDATGTAAVRRQGDGESARWLVSIDGVLIFSPHEPWVPTTEPMQASELEIVGGCC